MRVTLACLTMAGSLAGCVQRPPAETVPPNPFGYLKPSAVCKTGAVAKTAAGLEVTMRTRSDDGYCGVRLSQPEGGVYSSFLLSTLPSHGNGFIYNYNKHTVVNYTAATAYAGNDSFAVSLVPGDGRPRVPLKVLVSVDATGVPVPPPPAPPPPVVKPAPHHVTRHKVIRKHKPPAG